MVRVAHECNVFDSTYVTHMHLQSESKQRLASHHLVVCA